MRRLTSAVVLCVLVASAGPLFAQDKPPAGTPASEGERLSDLERKIDQQQRAIDEQQREIESLKREKEAADLKKKPAPDEKGAVHEAAEKKPSAPQFEWGYDDGFFVRGVIHDQNFEVRPVARIQLDYRVFPHSSENDLFQNKPPEDQFLVRRARAGFAGRFGVFGFDLEVDPTRNTATQLLVADFWFEYRQFPEIVVRFGSFKAPWGLEDGMTSDNFLDFVERPMFEGSGTNLAPDFHPGAMVYGTFGSDKFSHGLFQDYVAAQNQTQNNVVGSGEPMTSARLASEVGPVLVGVSGRWENRSGIPPTTVPPTAPSVTQGSFPGLTPGQFQFFAPVLVRGWTQAYGVDASLYQGPFMARGEFGYANQQRKRVLADHTDGTALIQQGSCITFGWLFAGPAAGSGHPTAVPFQDWQVFNMDAQKNRGRNVGAELLLRFDWVDISEAHGGRKGQGNVPAVPSTAADADKVKGNDCKSVGAGLNFYPIENVKFMLDYDHLRIGDQSRAERAHSRFADEILMRAQLEF